VRLSLASNFDAPHLSILYIYIYCPFCLFDLVHPLTCCSYHPVFLHASCVFVDPFARARISQVAFSLFCVCTGFFADKTSQTLFSPFIYLPEPILCPEQRRSRSSLPLSALSILFFLFFFHPNKPHQLFFPLPTRLFTIAPCCLLSPDLLSFIDHVYDMTGTPLSLFFSRLLKGQEMIRVGGEENTSLH
jgi:hypothetical protein